jgi:Tfp pilus assembly protein PilV
MKTKIASKKKQLGQSLIETLVAIFILVTGLISAITLAIYSHNATENSSKQIVAAALARESIEAVKNIRDSNWLTGTLTDCDDLGAGQKCYPTWQGVGANKLSQGDMVVDFSTAGATSWTINKSPANYYVYYDSSNGQYHNSIVGDRTIYSRKVHIDEDTTAPYTSQNPRLLATVTVWWYDRGCLATTDPTTLPASCKVILQSYFTNWRTY